MPFQLLENEIFKFEESICDFEEDLNGGHLSEEMRDAVFTAIGKAKLLMAQKLAQFRGLCDKNIVSNNNVFNGKNLNRGLNCRP